MRIGIGTSIVGSNFIGGEREYIDDVGGLPTAAYSVFKVVSTYTDAVVEVRRTVSAVTVEADVAFDGDTITLDSAVTITSGSSSATTLGEFVAASGYTDVDSLGSAQDAFVTTWYDQAGSNDATQTTAANQPKIVNAGALVTENGKAALDFDGTDDFLEATGVDVPQPASIITVARKENSSVYFDGLTSRITLLGETYDVRLFSGNTPPLSVNLETNAQFLFFVVADTTDTVYANSIQKISGDSGSSSLTSLLLGRQTTGINYANQKMQEFVLYGTNKSALRTAIEGNINGRFNIYA